MSDDLERLRRRVSLGDLDAAWELITLAGRHHDAESLEMAVRLLRARPLSPDDAVGTQALPDSDEERELPEHWTVSSLILELNTELLGWRRGEELEVPLEPYLDVPPDVFSQAATAFRDAGWEVRYPVHDDMVFSASRDPERRRHLTCPRCRIDLHLFVDTPTHGFGFDQSVEELRASLDEGRRVAQITCDRCRFQVEVDTGEGRPGLVSGEDAESVFLDALYAAIRVFSPRKG